MEIWLVNFLNMHQPIDLRCQKRAFTEVVDISSEDENERTDHTHALTITEY